jgi:hypothetical protein
MEEVSGFITISNPGGIQRGLQGQDGTTTENGCYITGGSNICPASADFTFDGVVKRLTAELVCPLDAVAQSDFREASQLGLCECNASINVVNSTDDTAEPLVCTCFVCPSQAEQFGVAYICETPISGNCLSFNCAGQCNGDPNLDLMGQDTKAPTAAPKDTPSGPSGSAAFTTHPAITSTALVLLCLARMFR